MKGFEEFLAAPLGGAVITMLIWFGGKGPCRARFECVHLAGNDIYSPTGLTTAGGVIGLVLAFLIHAVRT